MPVSKDDVIYGFRFFLDREPEDDTVVAEFQRFPDFATLRKLLVESEEHRAKFPRSLPQQASVSDARPPIGRHMVAEEPSVQVHGEPHQLDAMFDRIASFWSGFGETEPHFSVLTNPAFLSDQLDQNLDAFFGHGRYDVERSMSYLARAGLPTTGFRRALDFGCGVGRLTVAIAPKAAEVVGVDVSAGHIAEAKKSAAMHGVDNATFVQIHSVEAIDGLGDFDFILSRIVLQHNPPPIIASIYEKLLARLAPGGVSVIQIPTYIDQYRFSIDQYLAGPAEPMEMNPLPQREIFEIIHRQGCLPLEVREDDTLGVYDGLSHTFAVLRSL